MGKNGSWKNGSWKTCARRSVPAPRAALVQAGFRSIELGDSESMAKVLGSRTNQSQEAAWKAPALPEPQFYELRCDLLIESFPSSVAASARFALLGV